MTTPPALAVALKRLTAAIDHLDAAADRRSKADAARGDLDEELAIMQDDRSRLAIELEGALGRLSRMESAHQEAERRLDQASATIRAVLGEEETPAVPHDGES
jgi:chromosome segregation ATPase